MITLIGKNLAQKGNSFIYYGPIEECETCRFKSTCVDSLEKNRRYKITKVIDNEQKCPIHDENIVMPVEVEKESIKIFTPSKNTFEGSTFSYTPIECNETCEFKKYCIPEGLFENDKCIIMKNNGKHKECKKGYNLTELILAFVD